MQDIYRELIESFLFLWTLFLDQYKKLTWLEIWEFIRDRFPPLKWIPEYTLDKFRLDCQVCSFIIQIVTSPWFFISPCSGWSGCWLHANPSVHSVCLDGWLAA